MVFSLGKNSNHHAQSSPSLFSSSSSSSCENENLEGRVEVTVQRLDGVAWLDASSGGNSNNTKQQWLPHVTATVSFSGSAEDMQIGSSTVCGLTGQLLVESAPIRLDSTCASFPSSSPDDPLILPEHKAKNVVWLTAEWPEDDVNVTTTTVGTTQPQHPTVTDSTTSSTITSSTTMGKVQPHVRMPLPGVQADPRLPKPCLVQSNRGSKIVKQESNSKGHHKKTNSNAGLETAATCITDFTSFSSEGEGRYRGTTPPLSPSLSSASSGQELVLNHQTTTSTSITGMEKLLNNQHQQHHNKSDDAAQIAIAMARGESAFWSHSGNAMPEILELYIRLRCHDSSQDFASGCTDLWEGVSFLVLFGQEDDKGSHIVDLPVRRPFSSVDPADLVGGRDASPTSDGPRLFLTSQARLRLKVTIIPDKLRRNKHSGSNIISIGPQQHHAQHQPLMTTSIDAPSLESPVEVRLTRSTLEAKLKPLMDKIRENELLALQQWQAQKRAMDVHVPVPLNDNNNNLGKENERIANKSSYFYYPARGPQHAIQDGGGCNNYCNNNNNNNGSDSVFADMIWSWDRVVNLITLPCGSCDGRFSSAVVDPRNDKDVILLQRGRGNNNSPLMVNLDTANFRDDSSTIATRESWGI